MVSATVPNIEDLANWIGNGSSAAKVYEVCLVLLLFRCSIVRCDPLPSSSEMNTDHVNWRDMWSVYTGEMEPMTSNLLESWTVNYSRCCSSTLPGNRSWYSARPGKASPNLSDLVHRTQCYLGVMDSAEQLLKEFSEIESKRGALPWTRPRRSALLQVDAHCESGLIRIKGSSKPFTTSVWMACSSASSVPFDVITNSQNSLVLVLVSIMLVFPRTIDGQPSSSIWTRICVFWLPHR